MKKRIIIYNVLIIIFLLIMSKRDIYNGQYISPIPVIDDNLVCPDNQVFSVDGLVTDNNGVGDTNRTKLQKVLTDAGNCAKNNNKQYQVVVPAGKYYVSSMLYIFSNTKLTLNANTTFISTNGGIFISTSALDCVTCDANSNNCTENKTCLEGKGGYTQWSNITIEGGTWDSSGIGVSILGRHGDNLTIKNTTLKNTTTHSINISASKNVLVDGVTIKDQVQVVGKHDGQNEVIHLDNASTGETTAYPVDNTAVQNIVISNCIFDNVRSGIGSHSPYSAPNWGSNIRIEGNKFKNVVANAINLFAHQNVTIKNNTWMEEQSTPGYSFVQFYYTGNGNNGIKIEDNKLNSKNYEHMIINGCQLPLWQDASGNATYKCENDKPIYDNNIRSLSCSDDKCTITYNTGQKNNGTIINGTVVYDGNKNDVSDKFYYYVYRNGSENDVSLSPDDEKIKGYYGCDNKLKKDKFVKLGYKLKGWKAYNYYDQTWRNNASEGTLWEKNLAENERHIYGPEYNTYQVAWSHQDIVIFYAQWQERTEEENVIKEVKVTKNPTKVKYNKDKDNLDLTGAQFRIDYNDNTSDLINLNDYQTNSDFKITGFDNTKVGTQTITVTYRTKSSTFEVEIIDGEIVEIPNTGKISIASRIGLIIIFAATLVMGAYMKNKKVTR